MSATISRPRPARVRAMRALVDAWEKDVDEEAKERCGEDEVVKAQGTRHKAKAEGTRQRGLEPNPKPQARRDYRRPPLRSASRLHLPAPVAAK